MRPSLAYAHVVASALAADGRMDDAERAFLHALLDRLGLDEAERDAVLHFEGADEATTVVGGLPEADRRAILDDVIQAVLADGHISPLEQDQVARITELLGL